MKLKLFLQLISVLFAARVFVVVLYFILGWKVTFAGWMIPMWMAVLGVAVDSYMSYLAFKFSKKK